MKIIHTADWHLGNIFHGHSREQEFAHFLCRMLEILRAEQPDALIIAGDVFDSANPSADAERRFFDFLMAAGEVVGGLQIVIIAGNHDSAGRLEAPAELFRRHNIYVRGTLRREADSEEPDYGHYILPLSSRQTPEAEVVCFALPYLRPCDYPGGLTVEQGIHRYLSHMTKRLRASEFRGLPVVVAAHFYAAGADICREEHSERLVVGGQDAVSADAAECGAAYTALGHIHRAQRVPSRRGEVHYAGSPLPLSFSERGYRRGVMRVEIDATGRTEVSRIEYEPLRRLMAIPGNGADAPDEVLAAIEALPEREKGDDGAAWPYLEIRVAENEPRPSLMAEVAERLARRAVHFCRMVRCRKETEGTDPAEAPQETLAEVTPEEMAQRIFRMQYGEPMSEELLRRFLIAETEALDTQTDNSAENNATQQP